MCGCSGIRFFVVNLEVLTIAKLDHQLNEEIRDKEIRLIGADGAQLGIVSSAQANAMAELSAAPKDEAAELEAKYAAQGSSSAVDAELAKLKAEMGL